MGVDDPDDGSLAKFSIGQIEAGLCTCLAREWVDDEPAGVASDERDVRDVVPACLPQAGCDFEQAVDGVQPRLIPEAGVDRVRCDFGIAHEVVATDIPHRAPALLDHSGGVCRNHAAGDPIHVRGVRDKSTRRSGEQFERLLGGRLGHAVIAHCPSVAALTESAAASSVLPAVGNIFGA